MEVDILIIIYYIVSYQNLQNNIELHDMILSQYYIIQYDVSYDII